MQVNLQFFDRERQKPKGWLGSTWAGPDDRQFWEAWCLHLAVAPPSAAQQQQGGIDSGVHLSQAGSMLHRSSCAGE